jgi:hypothetical protein
MGTKVRSTLERLEYSVPSYLHPVRSDIKRRIVIKNNEIACLVHFSKFCGGVYSSKSLSSRKTIGIIAMKVSYFFGFKLFYGKRIAK